MAADATALLLTWRQGDEAALNDLISLVYQELRRMAHRYLAGQRPVIHSRRLSSSTKPICNWWTAGKCAGRIAPISFQSAPD
jgi:hypothetical protein